MEYVYTLVAPRRAGGEIKTVRHVYGCPESQYGIEFEPTEQDLADQTFVDCPCMPSPVATGEPAGPPAGEPPLPPAQRQGWPRGYRADEDEHRSRQQQDQPQQQPFEEADPEPAPVESWRKATLAYSGTFEFMLDMQKRSRDHSWTPTPKQLAAIEKSLAREGKPPQQEESVAEGLDIMPLGDFRYAVQVPDGGYYALVLSTGEGKWEGWRFVMGKDLPSGEIERVGRQKPAERYSGGRKRELVTVLAEPNLALDQYYEQTGICPLCFIRHEPDRCPF